MSKPPDGSGTRVEPLLKAAVAAVGGTPREGQEAMATAVAEAITSGRHLLVQAGTGTGKSLAYLVPALEAAVRTRRPVVVATATLALQSQIVERDLPRVAEAMETLLGRPATFQLVKGRSNYLCRHKLDGGFPAEDGLFDLGLTPVGGAGPSSRLEREVTRLREWAETTVDGDRDEVVPGVSERAWRQVSVSAHECLGAASCPQAAECHCEIAREKARSADLVVTNHAFVAIDAFGSRKLLPEHEVLIVDEAHELVDRVTSVISDELTVTAVEVAARRARAVGIGDTSRLDDAASILGAALSESPAGRLEPLPEFLAVAVGAIRDAARDLASRLQPAPGEKPAEGEAVDGGRQVARAAIQDVYDIAHRLASVDEHEVVWVSRQTRNDGSERQGVHVAPLSVAGLLREQLFGERTVVLTSATLTLGGDFRATAASLGLSGPEAPEWTGQDVGSPFDYQRQAILYVARHLPRPGRDGLDPAVLDELEELIRAAGGRTLGLFSSRRAAEAAAEEMRERLDVPVLCQGDDSMPTLVKQFAADEPTCLFGTLTLWQGVDVPGPSCQLVVIDRIPFPRPDDPLASARQEAVSQAGGNGFMAVAATHAALRLAQGAGRLVRSASDRGAVVVLDPRLATARYGSFLRESMPPFWSTGDREVVLAALRRIDETARSANLRSSMA